MLKKWKTTSAIVSLSAIMLLGLVTAPHAAELHNGCAANQAAVEPTKAPVATVSADNTANTTSPAQEKKQKSVLDAEALESPLSLFKDITSSDEEESEMSVKPGVMVMALKALVATLLSTII